MVTNEERREVARRLREYASWDDEEECLVDCADWGERVLNLLDCGDSEGECYAALADLIEPSCDRDALLALADKLECDGECDGCDMSDGIWCDAQGYAARRIREACGEVVA